MWYKEKELKERRAERAEHAERAEVEGNQALKLNQVTIVNESWEVTDHQLH